MKNLNEEEETLLKKLQDLEEKYKENPFSEEYANEIETEISKDFSKREELINSKDLILPKKNKIKPPLPKELKEVIIDENSENENNQLEKETGIKVNDTSDENNKLNKNIIIEGVPDKIQKEEYTKSKFDLSRQEDEIEFNEEPYKSPPLKIIQTPIEEIKEDNLDEPLEFGVSKFKFEIPKKEILNDEEEIDKKIENTDEKIDEIKIDEKKVDDKILQDEKIFKKETGNKDDSLAEKIKHCSEILKKVKKEVAKVVIGQENVVDGLLRGLICNGHVLLEGVPGIAKTLTIKALGEASGCNVNRIQFTVDLLPTDIIGITSFSPQKGFEIIKGPIFTNFLIADEINRSPPKTQSALIEGMQEKQVTIGKESFQLPSPFFVMATKNPLESTGVYSLPEAQMDRFLFNIIMGYPKEREERRIMEENTTLNKFEDYGIKSVITPDDIIMMQKIVKDIYLSDHIKSYILSIVWKTRDKHFKHSDCIGYGASPRASISLFIASKARALIEGRTYVLPEDVKEVVNDVMRHRLILTYKATVKGLTAEDIIRAILEEIRVD